jgi:hypothetical protein
MVLRAVLLGGCAALLAACQSSQVVTGAGGTLRQAETVVRLVYGDGAAVPAYRAGNIAPAIERMRARMPALRPAYAAGVIGVDAEGYVRVRESSSADAGLAREVARDNLDRSILYNASAEEVGHGINDRFGDWMPFERDAFARQWVAQAPEGWWHRAADGTWRRTPGPSTRKETQ